AVAARTRVADDPTDAERKPAVGVDLDRHLVVAAADPARLHLEARLHVVDRLLEDFQRIVAGLLLYDVEALIEEAPAPAPLAVWDHAGDGLGPERALIEGVRRPIALGYFSSSRHLCSLSPEP